MNGWLDSAVAIWSSGYTQPGAGGGQVVAPTYTEERHLAMLIATGLVPTGIPASNIPDNLSRRHFLRSWKQQESPNHWGLGSPRTPYRMTEGSGDEMGSMSFNQVQYGFRYGPLPCRAHHDAGLNYFDPEGNIQGFIIHLASPAGSTATTDSCTGSFSARYGSTTPAYRTLPPDLVAYRDDVTIHPVNGNARQVEDDYELLAHGIGGYNGDPNLGGDRSWPEMLRVARYVPPIGMSNAFNADNSRCSSCAYALEVLDRFFPRLHRRTYIWAGARHPANLKNPDGSAHADANKPIWCFAYGEREWRNPGFQVPDPSNPGQTTPASFADYRLRAANDVNARTPCN